MKLRKKKLQREQSRKLRWVPQSRGSMNSLAMASGGAQRWTSKLASQISMAGGRTPSFMKRQGDIGDGGS